MIMTTIWLSSQLACWCVTRCCCALNFVWRSIEGDLSRVVWFSDCWTMIQHDPTMQHRGLGLFFKSLFSWASQLPLRTSDFLQFDLWQIADRHLKPRSQEPIVDFVNSVGTGLLAKFSWIWIWTSTAHRCVFCVAQKEFKKHTAYWVDKLVFNRDRI